MDVVGVAPGARGSRTLIHLGMALATLAFASWWTSRTVLDVARTRRVATTVLESPDLRGYVARSVAPVVARVVGPAALGGNSPAPAAAATNRAETAELTLRLTAVLDRPDVRAELEQFVVDAHERLIGLTSGPAVLDQPTVQALAAAAVPGLGPETLAKIPRVAIDVPRAATLVAGRRVLDDHLWWFAVGAFVLLVAAIATSRDRHAAVKVIGRWLIGISVVHLLVLWIIPVVIVPRVSSSPWASLVASVARALGTGLVSGLVLLAATGGSLLLADRVVPGLRPVPTVAPTGAPAD